MEKKEYIIKIDVNNKKDVKPSKSNQEQTIDGSESFQNQSTKDIVKKLAPVVTTGKTLVNFASSNIGNFTGSSSLQVSVNNAMASAGLVWMATKTPIGAMVTMVTGAITSSITDAFDRSIREKTLEQARYKVGYTASNRSRA